ncbi:MAG: PVC-type heme-binding CxxCH protein, partial [Verrucomicrobiota bacterium]
LGFASDDGARKWQTERRPGQPAPIAEWRQEDPGTIPAGDVYGNGSPTGICFYENGGLGDQHSGLLLSCEAARNVVFGYYPVPEGAGFKLERFDFFRSKKAEEFAEDGETKAAFANKFRPSDVTVGPDGAIYVADWFDDGVGGHRMTDPLAAGTIYRIAPKGSKLSAPKLDLETTDGQIAALKSSANNVRNSGFTRLKTGGADSIPAVKAMLDDANPYFQARAIWLLAQLGGEGIQAVEAQLNSTDPQMRIAAFRALRFVDSNTLAHAQKLASDESIAVRREVALALRDRSIDESKEIIVELAKSYDGQDRWFLEAIGTACANKEKQIYPVLLIELGNEDALKWSSAFAKLAWRLHPPAAAQSFRKRAMSTKFPVGERKDMLTALGFIPTKAAAMAMVLIAEKGPQDTRPLAQWWLYNRGTHVWAAYVDQMKGLNKKPNAMDPNKSYPVPITGPEITQLNVSEVLKLEGNAKRGQATIARCYMCHQVDGDGVDFGPALDEWGRGQSPEAIATAIIDPNAGIAHGFEGTEIETKKGNIIQGFSMFAGGSHILKVMGGGEVTISRRDIKTVKTLDKSLMMSAGQLGLQAQDVADIVAFLKKGVSDAATAVPAAKPTASANLGGTLSAPLVKKLTADGRDITNGPAVVWGDTTGKKRVLFVAGNTVHNHGFHEYRAGSLFLANALNQSGLPITARVHWWDWPEDESVFEGVDTIVMYSDSGGKLTADQYARLDKRIQAGTGLVMMHYALHPEEPYREKYYKPWVGG